MNLTFQLSGRSGDDLYANVYWGKNRYKRAIGIKVPPKYWNKTTMRVMITSDFLPAKNINVILDRLRDKVEDKFYELMAISDAEPSYDQVAAIFDREKHNPTTLVQYAEKYIERLKIRTNGRTGVVISKVTWQKHSTVLEKLKEFQSGKAPVELTSADMEFYESFVAWMVARNYSMNTIGKHMSIIRSWLSQADSESLKVSPAYRSRQWYIGRERVQHVSLSMVDLNKLKSLQISGTDAEVRDAFLLCAYTGLRYSDLKRLGSAEFKNGLITIEQQKTSNEVVVPELPEVSAILQPYRERGLIGPSVLSNPQMNAALKRICDAAGLHDAYTVRKTIGGKRVETTMRVCDAVTTHTARRSFAKNLYLTGFNLSWLSRILGHSSQEQTIEYIALDNIEKAMLLKTHLEQASNRS